MRKPLAAFAAIASLHAFYITSSQSFQIRSDSTSIKTLPRASVADSTRQDTLKRISRLDTLVKVIPIELLGTIDRNLSTDNIIDKNEIQWYDYKYIGDFLFPRSGVYIRDLGSVGQPNQLNIEGMDGRHIAFLMDGRPMNEPLSGVFDMNQFPTEYIERMEIVSGVRGFLYGLNGTGATINLVTPSYNTNKPVSRLRHIEGPYEFLYTDGLFSQNVVRNLNLMAALTRQSMAGRFPNTAYDAWSIRSKIRYNISSCVSLSLSELFNQTSVGLNGGVDLNQNPPPETIFNPYLAPVRSTTASDKITRHDINLTLGARLFPDSTNVSTLTLYYSHFLREYQDSPLNAEHETRWFGLNLKQNYDTELQGFNCGFETGFTQLLASPNAGAHRDTRMALYAIEELRLLPSVNLAAFGRYDRYEDDLFSFGMDARVKIADSLFVFGGLSWSYRVPTLTERFWSDTSGLVSWPSNSIKNEKHRYIELGVKFDASNVFSIRATYFRREVSDAIVTEQLLHTCIYPPPLYWRVAFTNISRQTYIGVESQLRLRVWKIYGEGSCTHLLNKDWDVEKLRFPKWFLNGQLYFWGKLVDEHLQLKIGVKGKYFTEQYGEEYYPESAIYAHPMTSPFGTTNQFGPYGSIDFFAIGKIGDAYIHVIWENLTNQNYYLTPVYPMPDRTLRFGISWAFLD